jgi:hypothetical protein
MTTPMIDDEVAARTAFADLTAGQPAFPAGRFAAVKHRAVMHRRRQLAGGALAVAVAVALAVSLSQLVGAQQPPPPARSVPRWALPWPDHRNGSVPQQVLDRAVIAALYSGQGAQAPALPLPDGGRGTVPARGASASSVSRQANAYPVIWYVGQTVDHGRVVEVMFEMDGPNGPQLVVGQATASEVMHDQPAWSDTSSPWALTEVPAPDPAKAPPAIGNYVTGRSSGGGGQNPDNWMVLLTAPDVRRVSWYETTTGGPRLLSMPTSAGLAITDTGQVTGDIELTGLTTSRGTTRLDHVRVAVGDQVQVPQLAAPPALSLPRSFSLVIGSTSQGSSGNLDQGFRAGRLRYAVFGICYGPAPVQVKINGHSIGSITCDSQTHQLSVPASDLRGHGHQLWLDFAAPDLDAWDLAFGTMR